MRDTLRRFAHVIIRLVVRLTSRRLRKAIYSIPLIGYQLQMSLTRILKVILYTDKFQWVKFRSGQRAGLEMKLKLHEEYEYSLETHDADVSVLLCKHIQPGFKVIDVGAHIGYFTLLISRLVGPEGKVFALEPSPGIARRLKEHLFKNQCSENSKVLQLAAAEYNKKEHFLEFGFATIARFSSVECFVKGTPSSQLIVECRSLDSLIQDGSIEPPDFVKIDVEGAELRVLQGMKNLLRIYKPKLLIEFHNEKIIKEIIDFLENRRYRTYYVTGKMLKKSAFPQVELGESLLFIYQ